MRKWLIQLTSGHSRHDHAKRMDDAEQENERDDSSVEPDIVLKE